MTDLSARAAEDAAARAAGLARRYAGATGELHDKKSQRRELGSDHYAGGIVIEGTAAAHPALYAQGLIVMARRGGHRRWAARARRPGKGKSAAPNPPTVPSVGQLSDGFRQGTM